MATVVLSKMKQAKIDAAWEEYRAASQAIPLTTPYSGWKRAGVLAEKEIKA